MPFADKSAVIAAPVIAGRVAACRDTVISHRRPAVVAQRSLAEWVQRSAHALGQRQRVVQLFGGAAPPIAVAAEFASSSRSSGLPAALKGGIESLSGLSMGAVKVHYRSPEPARIGALAFARGNEIHLGPQQEQHLPHEAWHVVQQAQGRVEPTLQPRVGGPINDDRVLEREADAMGALALRHPAPSPSVLAAVSSGSGTDAVVQRRLPPLTEGQVEEMPGLVRESLLLGLHQLSEEEQKALVDAVAQADHRPWTLEAIDSSIRNDDAGYLGTWHQWLMRHTPSTKRYEPALKRPVQTLATPEQVLEINNQVKAKVLKRLEALLGKHDLHRTIFGPGCDVYLVDSVFERVLDALAGHVKSGTSPMVGLGNVEHSQWVGVGGMTSPGSKVVELGLAPFADVIAGGPSGLSTLVHEYTHATASTKDLAYDQSGLVKLTTAERMQNAETFAQEFLELIQPNPARHYDESKVVVTGPKQQGQVDKPVQERTAGIKKRMVELWNAEDNVFGIVRLAVAKEHDPVARAKHQSLVWLGTYPHRPVLRFNAELAMALVEDRTRVLKELKSKPKMVNAGLRARGVDAERMKSPIGDHEREFTQLSALLLMTPLNLSLEQATTFIDGLMHLREHGEHASAKEAPDSELNLLQAMQALAEQIRVETSSFRIGTRPRDLHDLGEMLLHYRKKHYSEAKVRDVIDVFRRAGGVL